MRVSERLRERLRADGYDPGEEVAYRVGAGYWQRARGAWSWGFFSISLGSQYAMTDLLRCPPMGLRNSSPHE